MSTKDISRSAIEGGRANHSKNDRNESHRHERSRVKVWLDRVRFDDEVAEYSDPVPRNPVKKDFTDKLGPCYGWLHSHCGQTWDDVRSKLARTFDTRKLSAWHIVNQHMLTEVEGAGTTSDAPARYRSQRFYIDEDGLLQDRGRRYYLNRTANEYNGPSEAVALAWARGRLVVDKPDEPHYWALPEKVDRWDPCKSRRGRCAIPPDLHRYVETTSKWAIQHYSQPGFRGLGQGDWWRTYRLEHHVTDSWRYYHKMTKAEVAWWNTLSYEIHATLRARSF